MKIKNLFYLACVTIGLNTITTDCLPSFKNLRNYLNNIRSTISQNRDRQWLNVTYRYDNFVINNPHVISNIDYFHAIIKHHHDRLMFKNNSREIILKIKKISIYITALAVIFQGGFTCWSYQLLCKTKKLEGNLWPALCFTGFTLFSLYAAVKAWHSYNHHDAKMAHHIRRDKHMLQQFEEYKATMDTQNGSVKQETT
ncbi:MAG: hypothetical protein ACOYT8_04145 [Candidatus Dependentiae bacterium]